jgi:D-alanine-D-alanine ligase
MIKVAILFGGPGSEHEVSLSSAKNILENIDRSKFDVLEVLVTKDKKYKIGDSYFEEEKGIQEIKNKGIEIVFPIIHGEYGEDGELQEKLEKEGIKFVGSSSEVSCLVIDKDKTNAILSKNGIKIPKSKIISKEDNGFDCKYPIIIKPVSEGSSVGLFRFENVEDYKNSQEKIFENHNKMLVQEFIKGREFTCGVIEKDGEVTSLVATEIILTKGSLFDYEAKYTPSGCREVTPAEVDNELMNRIQDTAVSCHKILGCKSISRTDIILKGDDLYVLEVNTMPGMTKTSFIPAQAKACGYDMKELITILIESTWKNQK